MLNPDAFSTSRPANPNGPVQYYVVFCVEQQQYALPLHQVSRALRMVAITPLPDAPTGIRGVINVAGQAVPLLDLRPRLGHPTQDFQLDDRLLIIQAQDQTVALAVDEIRQILEVSAERLSPPPPVLARACPLITTIQGETLILVLDIDQLLPTNLVVPKV
jgi:purine-binding chemotaxis protein CheW